MNLDQARFDEGERIFMLRYQYAIVDSNRVFYREAGPRDAPRDNPGAEVHLYDTGHFALETQHREIAAVIVNFLDRNLLSQASAA
jgi:hypothetical protein